MRECFTNRKSFDPAAAAPRAQVLVDQAELARLRAMATASAALLAAAGAALLWLENMRETKSRAGLRKVLIAAIDTMRKAVGP